MFVTLDGVDGVGKSTQLKRLVEWLEAAGISHVTCRDPGSSPLGEKVRAILLQATEIPIHRRSEMLLYMAARAQLVEEVVRPALARGALVLSDRFLTANVVYQGHAGGLDVEEVRRVGLIATGGILPDLTLILDMPARDAATRMGREPDRMESQGIEYLEQVRQGFLREAERDPERVVVVDAARDVSAVQEDLRQHLQQRLSRSPKPD